MKFNVPYHSSLSPFSGTVDVSLEEIKRKQEGHRSHLTNDNGYEQLLLIYVAD